MEYFHVRVNHPRQLTGIPTSSGESWDNFLYPTHVVFARKDSSKPWRHTSFGQRGEEKSLVFLQHMNQTEPNYLLP